MKAVMDTKSTHPPPMWLHGFTTEQMKVRMDSACNTPPNMQHSTVASMSGPAKPHGPQQSITSLNLSVYYLMTCIHILLAS